MNKLSAEQTSELIRSKLVGGSYTIIGNKGTAVVNIPGTLKDDGGIDVLITDQGIPVGCKAIKAIDVKVLPNFEVTYPFMFVEDNRYWLVTTVNGAAYLTSFIRIEEGLLSAKPRFNRDIVMLRSRNPVIEIASPVTITAETK